jgi:hypothetical protein
MVAGPNESFDGVVTARAPQAARSRVIWIPLASPDHLRTSLFCVFLWIRYINSVWTPLTLGPWGAQVTATDCGPRGAQFKVHFTVWARPAVKLSLSALHS